MIFFYKGRGYEGATAIEIVREMATDASWSPRQGGSIRDFLRREVAALCDRIHPRDLGLAHHHSEEMLAFNYLCLLDEYGIGRLCVSAQDQRFEPEADR